MRTHNPSPFIDGLVEQLVEGSTKQLLHTLWYFRLVLPKSNFSEMAFFNNVDKIKGWVRSTK